MAKKVGSVYAEIRAKLDKLEKDMAKAQGIAVAGTKKMQRTYDSLNFNKSIQGMKSMIGQAAVMYAALSAGQKMLESAIEGTAILKQEKAFTNLAASAGASSDAVIKSLKAVSRGMVSEADLIKSAGTAMMLGIPVDKLADMMRIAEATSRQTGQTVTEAFNDISKGVGRQSRMILDNLGIIVDVDKANKSYATSLGKTSDALTDAEKKQAFMNAVLSAGNDLVNRIGSSGGALEGANRLVAAHRDLWAEINKTIATFLDGELGSYVTVLEKISGILKNMREGKDASGKSSAWQEIEMLRSLEAKGLAQPGGAAAKEAAYNKKYLVPQFGMKESEELKRRGSFQSDVWGGMASWREREGNYAANTKEQNEAIIKAREEMLKRIEEAAKKARAEAEKLNAEIVKLSDEFAESKVFSGEGSNYERMEAMLRGGGQIAQMEADRLKTLEDDFIRSAEEENKMLMERVRAYEQANQQIIEDEKRKQEILKDTANIMAQNFSDAFADMITGTQTVEKAFTAMVNSIISSMIRMSTQKGFEQIFGMLMTGLPGLFGGGAANLPINKPGYFSSVQPFHSGGIAGTSGGPSRSIPAAAFSFAPRLHNGLMPDEFPAVLQKGERVIPRGGGAGNNITINIAAPNGRVDRESISAMRAGLFAELNRQAMRNS